jgi:hypothetical protein
MRRSRDVEHDGDVMRVLVRVPYHTHTLGFDM